MEDVVIIGGGITGCSIARELSRYDIKITLVEKEEDVACGTSKGNSAVVHAGFDASPGTWKAKLNVAGNKLYPALCEELDVPFVLNESLVVAVSEEEERVLEELLEKGRLNGVNNLRIIGKDELQAMEPNLSSKARAALDAPTGGLVCPYEFTIALAENANQNGVKFWLNAMVTDIEKLEDSGFLVKTSRGSLRAKYVINAAGLFADELSKIAGAEEYTITPRKGEYLVFDKQFSGLVKKTIFPTPSKISKGILVCPTVDGNIFIGPNSNNIQDKLDTSVKAPGIKEIIEGGKKLVPNLPFKNVITSFAGLRAVSNTNDFIIEASKQVKGFVNVGGIQSPGLTSAPAIAQMVKGILQDEGLILKEKPTFNPHRPMKKRFRELNNEEREQLIKQNPAYGHIICRCETVTEAEIIDAIRRPVGARSIDAVKEGLVQAWGGVREVFALQGVLEILARELGADKLDITKKGPGSNLLLGRIKEFLQVEGGDNNDN